MAGVSDDGVKQLEFDIEGDKKDGQPTIGPKIKKWLAEIGKYLGKEGAKTGFEMAKKLATKWLLQHFALDAG